MTGKPQVKQVSMGDQIAGRRRMPAYAEVFYAIRQSILCGDSAPGQRIATEQELARQYGVSVGTIRKTQQMLVDDGLLIKQQGSGTFVAPSVSQQRRILWVCGVDVVGGDISPYYSSSLDACYRFGAQVNLTVEPAWVSHHRLSDAQPYMGPDAQSRYAGYVFVGCVWEEHPLLRHVIHQGLPHVHISHWDRHPRGLLIDMKQAVELATTTLREQDCQKISIVGFKQHLQQIKSLLKRLDVNALPATHGNRMSEVEHHGLIVTETFQPESRREGLIFMDDILARGGTRALLGRSRAQLRSLRVAVIGSRRSVIPLGLPVTHIVHDSEQCASAAIDMLRQQIGSNAQPACIDLPYELLEEDAAVVSREMIGAAAV